MRLYCYNGLYGEKIPPNVTHAIIKNSVTFIYDNAFSNCWALVSVVMGDGVMQIGVGAFDTCVSLVYVRLSRQLEHIGCRAFANCISLESVFLPATINNCCYPDDDLETSTCTFTPLKKIGDAAFQGCTSLRILALPGNIDLSKIGINLVKDCDRMLATAPARGDDADISMESHRRNNKWLRDRYTAFPLHCRCFITYMCTADIINKAPFSREERRHHAKSRDNHGMTPLHIMTANPHAGTDAILAFYESNPNAVFATDDAMSTPIDYARMYNVEGLIALINVLVVGLD